MWIIADSWFRIDDRSVVMNKLRRLFNPTPEERAEDIAILKQYGQNAMDCLKDGKPVLSSILESQGVADF